MHVACALHAVQAVRALHQHAWSAEKGWTRISWSSLYLCLALPLRTSRQLLFTLAPQHCTPRPWPCSVISSIHRPGCAARLAAESVSLLLPATQGYVCCRRRATAALPCAPELLAAAAAVRLGGAAAGRARIGRHAGGAALASYLGKGLVIGLRLILLAADREVDLVIADKVHHVARGLQREAQAGRAGRRAGRFVSGGGSGFCGPPPHLLACEGAEWASTLRQAVLYQRCPLACAMVASPLAWLQQQRPSGELDAVPWCVHSETGPTEEGAREIGEFWSLGSGGQC